MLNILKYCIYVCYFHLLSSNTISDSLHTKTIVDMSLFTYCFLISNLICSIPELFKIKIKIMQSIT